MKLTNLLAASLFIILSLLILSPFIIFREMITILPIKPEGKLGILFINPISFKDDIKAVMSKYNPKEISLQHPWDVKVVEPTKGFFSVGNSGIHYQCSTDDKINTLNIYFDRDKIIKNSNLLNKRIELALIVCAITMVTDKNTETYKFAEDLIYQPNNSSAIF